MKKSGVYILYNIFTGRKYVGSSRNLPHRKSCHFHGIRRGRHENYKIQNEFNEYGEEGFRWEVLEYTSPDDLVEREQFWLDSIKPELNILLKADNHQCTQTDKSKLARQSQAEKMRGRKASDETKRKMSQSHLLHWADPKNREKLKRTPEQRKYLSEINTGEKNPNWGKTRSEATRSKAADTMSKTDFYFTNPEGEVVVIRNMAKFVRDTRLWGLNKLRQGKIENYRGWKFLRAEKLNSS